MSVRGAIKKEQFVSLKIFVHNQTKVFNFDISTLVETVLNAVYDSSPPEITSSPLAEYGLFVPNQRGRKPRWLQKAISLDAADCNSQDPLEFKKKQRPMRVMTVDGNVKMIYIDDSAVVRDIADAIGDKIGVKALEEFSLRKKTPAGMSKAPKWLSEALTLHDNDVTADETLEYAKKYYFSDDRVDQEDPFTLHLLYVDAQQSILTGRYPTSRANVIEFAGLQLQIQFGDHKPGTHTEKFFDKRTLIPAKFLAEDKKTPLLPDIINAHKRFVGIKETNAKYRYVTKVRSLPTYGITFFECTQVKEKTGDKKKDKEEPVPFLLGVSRSCLIRMEPETQKETNSWPIECIKRWSQTKGTFSIDFGDWEGDYFNFQTPESEALSALIYGYIEIIMKSRNDIGNVREDDDYYDTAEVESVKPIFGFGQDGVTAGYTQGYAATSQIPFHTPTGQFQNFNFPEFSRLVHQDTKELYGKAMMGSDGTQLTPKELAARQMLQKGGARPDNSPAPKTPNSQQPKQDYEPKLREMLNRVINQMDTLVDTMSQNSFPPILDQYKNILENDLQGLFNCLEGIQQDPDQQVALSHMVRATKPITDCIGDILELLAESETVLIDTYRDDIFDQIKCYWDAAKSSVLNDPALVDSPTIELINLASLQVAEKFSNLLDSLEQMISVPPDHMLLEESNYILAEIGKCRMINKMVNCNNMRLCQYFLDPDVNQAFVQMTEIVEHSKNTVIDFFDRSSFNDGNNNIHEIGREIDFDIDKLKFIVACADPQRPSGPDGNPLDYGETPEQIAAFKLRMAAKVNAASVLKLLNASENALRNCSDPTVANELWNAIQKGQGALMDLFVVMNQPVTPENPNALLNVAREQIPIFQELARVAKKATPLITDVTMKNELSGACQKMNRDLGYLFQNVQEVYNMSLGTEVNNPNVPQGASKQPNQLRGAPLSNSQSGAQLSQASQQQLNEEALAAKRELKKQAKVFIPKEEMVVAYQHIAKAKQILEEKNVDRVALAKQEAADAMFQTANRRRQVNFKMATESLSTSLKTMAATSNQLANVAAKNPAGCPVIMKMLSSTIEQVLQNALKAAASTDRPVSDQIIESAHFIADATQDLLMAVEAEANNKSPETARELEQRKLIVNDAINKLNQLLGISSEIRLPEVEKSLNDLKESMDFYLGGPAGLQGAGRLQGSVKLSGPQGSMLFSHNQPVCEFSVELKELAGIVAGITKSARSSTINHGAHAKEATAIVQKLLQSAAKVESDSVYAALTSDKDELFQLFDQIHNSSDQFVVLENMKKVNNTVQKLIVYGKEAAKKETDKGRQGQIIQNIQQLMTGFQNLQQSAAQTSTRGPADVSQIKQNVADLVATLLQNNASQSVSENDLVCDPLLAADISRATKALAQTTHDMLAASIKVAQNPQDMKTTQTFEASTKDVVNSLLELKKLTNGLDSGLKECAKAVNKIQTETSYILNDPRFQNDPNAYASLIDTSPERRAQSAALQAQAVTTLSQVEKQLQGLCGHLLQSETPLIGDQQQVDLKALAQSLSGLVPSFVGSINEIIIAQEDSNFRKNLVGNTRQLVQITEDLLKYSQTDYRNLTAEDLQRIAQLKIRAQESAGIVASELKIADTINQEIDKESQIIRGAIEKLLQPIHLVPQGQGGPQGPGQVRVVQGQGTNQRVSMSQGVNTNSQRVPPNAIPLGQNSNQPRMSVGPNGQPVQQGGQGFPRPSVGQGQGTNSQRIVQQGQNPNQQGGQMTSPRQGQPGNPQNPNQPRPSVGPSGQPINQGPTSPRGPQQGGPQGQPVRVQGQSGNPQNPQQGTNTQQRVVQGQPPQGGQQQGLNTLQRLMTNVQPGKGPAPNPAQGGPKMQHPQKLKPPQTYAEWKGVNLAAQREIVKATQFLQTCDKRNVESMTFAIRKQKAVLLSLVESARQCAALVKDENEKRELLNNAKVVCANVDSIFQDLKQASCGFDVQQNMNTKLNNINDGIAALLQSINRCEPEKPVIIEETLTETLTIEESKEFQEFITYLKGKVNGFYADQKPSRFSRDSCDDLFNTCTDVAKMLTKVLYTTKKDLTTLNTDAKPLIEKLFQLANSFHSHYHQHPLAADFKQQVGKTVLQFSAALETVANAKGNERKEIENAVQESIKNLTGIVGFITKISPKFSQEHADAERLMEEANRRMLAGAQGKSALEIKMEEELRQEREHQIRVIKIEKELQKEKDRALAEKKARFEAQQGGQ